MLDAWLLVLSLVPSFMRALPDFCGLSAFFHWPFLHFADFQPLATPNMRFPRRLIPMVRKFIRISDTFAPSGGEGRDEGVLRVRLSQHASRNKKYFLSPITCG